MQLTSPFLYCTASHPTMDYFFLLQCVMKCFILWSAIIAQNISDFSSVVYLFAFIPVVLLLNSALNCTEYLTHFHCNWSIIVSRKNRRFLILSWCVRIKKYLEQIQGEILCWSMGVVTQDWTCRVYFYQGRITSFSQESQLLQNLCEGAPYWLNADVWNASCWIRCVTSSTCSLVWIYKMAVFYRAGLQKMKACHLYPVGFMIKQVLIK